MTRGVYLHDDVTGKVLPKDEVLALRAKRKAEKVVRSGLFENRTVERGHWVYDKRIGELVPKGEYRPYSGVTIKKDTEAYLAVTGRKVDGKMVRDYIGGGKQHRDHLRAIGAVEVGNEKQKPREYTPPSSKEETQRDIARAMQETGYWRI